MAVFQQQGKHPRLEAIWHSFKHSDYITALTDWFMGLAGKATEIILYATVLYSCAQLYPGVHLPETLSLWMFLVQMGALDVGGLSLAKLARQAKKEGNEEGAMQARRLSYVLIGIMLVGVVTVGIEHVVSIPEALQTGIQIVLVVARSICSVLYGRVVHLLKTEQSVQPPAQIEQTARVQLPVQNVQTTVQIRRPKLHIVHPKTVFDFLSLCAITEQETAHQIEQPPAQHSVQSEPVDRPSQADVAETIAHETAQEPNTEELPVVNSAKITPLHTHRPVRRTAKQQTPEQKARAAVYKNPNISARELATLIGKSPSTANAWKSRFLAEMQQTEESPA